MNTANLQLEGLIMAVAVISDAVVKKGLLTHEQLGVALAGAELAVQRNDDAEISKSNQAAIDFPIRVLSLANQASQQGKFGDYAELVGRLA